jgi:hypothetical protein
VAGGVPGEEPSAIVLGEPVTVALPSTSAGDDAATRTLLLTFEVPETEASGSTDLRGLVTAIEDLDIVLQQNRSAEGGD